MKIKKCWLVDLDGSVTRLSQFEGKELSLKDMYSTIGCRTIEHIGLKKGVDMWIDEEGLLMDSPMMNKKATQMYRYAYKDNFMINSKDLAIFGKVIITDNTKAGDYLN